MLNAWEVIMETFVPKGNISGPILPEFVLKLSITAGAKLMYSILCWHAYDKDYCWPSYPKLAERMCCSINSVKNYFRELVKAKLVLVKKESYHSSKFFLLKPSEEMLHDCKDEHCVESIPSPQGVNPPKFGTNPSKFGENPSNFGPLKNPNKQIQQTPPMPFHQSNNDKLQNKNFVGAGDSFSDFEKVYDAYPRKEAKGLAKIAWTQLARNNALPDLKIILAAIARFSTSHNWQRENGRFIPQLSNFLKGERWNDPITESEIQEKASKEQSENAMRLRAQTEEQRRIEYEKKKAAHKPDFDAFAAKFKDNFHFPMVFGLWLHFLDHGKAPFASDVSENNKLGIVEFIKSFANHVRQAANSVMPQESEAKHPAPCSGNKLERSNGFRSKSSESAGCGFRSAGEILKKGPFFMDVKAAQPRLRQAVAC